MGRPGVQGAELVGRDGPHGRLLAALDEVLSGHGRLVLVSGEAGIGKTSLVATLAATAQDRAQVAWATCWEGGGAPGYWPWTQALDGLVEAVGKDRAAQLAGDDAAVLATVVPALGLGSHRSGSGDEEARLSLFSAVERWLARISTLRPVMIVLEDLHWADRSSLLLVDFLSRAHHASPLMIIGTYRHDELDVIARDRLAGMAARSDHIHLEGLDPTNVHTLVARVAGDATASRWGGEVHRRTGGHPFFVREIAYLLDTAEGPSGVPVVVQEAIDRRVSPVSESTRAVLDMAAVAGNELQLDVMADGLDLSPADVARAVDEAVAVGVVRLPEGGTRPRFTHDLFRETLYNKLSSVQRVALHHRVAVALEQRAVRVRDVPASEIARHLTAAIPDGCAEEAVTWALAAAEADRAGLAFSEAAGHLTRVRRAVADAGAAVPRTMWIDLLVAEADALGRAGDPKSAKQLLNRARAHAGPDTDPVRRAAVAFGLQRLGARFAMPRQEVVAVLEEARQAVAGNDISIEAQLTSALARELHHSVPKERERARPLSERALELARTTDDPLALASCLLARHDVLWTPGTGAERLTVAHEIAALAEQVGDDERRAEGLLLVANALLETGSPAFRPALDAYLAAVEGLGQPRHRYLALTRWGALALLDGRLGEAGALIEEAARLGERIHEPDTGNVRMSQLLELTRARGDADEQRAFAAEAVRWWVGAPVHAHAVAAGFLARAGALEDARRHVDIVLELGTWQADRSYLWSVLVGNLATAAARLKDMDLCRGILDDLLPLASSCGVNGAVVAFAGSHAHFAGVAAAALGRRDQAVHLLEQAVQMHGRLGAVPWEAESRAALAALVADDTSVSSGRPSAGQPVIASLRHGESGWAITFGPESARVPDVKGIRDLAQLLSRPGTDVHVLELAGSGLTAGTSMEAVDREALLAYRRRLAEIDGERDEAERHNDPERLARVEAEHQALVEELRRATGLGGQPRALGHHAGERARKAVSGRMRDAIRRIEPSMPGLAAHLDQYVVTGTYCRYRMDAGVTWEVEW